MAGEGDGGGQVSSPLSGVVTYSSIMPAVPGGRGMPPPKPMFRKPPKNPKKKNK